MIHFRPLSLWVEELLPAAQEISAQASLPAGAAVLAAEAWGHQRVERVPALVNVAALALATRDRLLVHQVRPGAARLAGETDLHTLPGEPPRLLRRAWICEVRRPEKGEELFSGTVGLAGYEVDEV